jgi:hypothetical protein
MPEIVAICFAFDIGVISGILVLLLAKRLSERKSWQNWK